MDMPKDDFRRLACLLVLEVREFSALAQGEYIEISLAPRAIREEGSAIGTFYAR
jgi:hypothetical protein